MPSSSEARSLQLLEVAKATGEYSHLPIRWKISGLSGPIYSVRGFGASVEVSISARVLKFGLSPEFLHVLDRALKSANDIYCGITTAIAIHSDRTHGSVEKTPEPEDRPRSPKSPRTPETSLLLIAEILEEKAREYRERFERESAGS